MINKMTAVLFSGQGTQYPGMMEELYEEYESVKYIFKVAQKSLGRDIRELCFRGTQEELNRTHNTQVCMLAADLSAAAALRENSVNVDVCAGFSLGEYAALVYSGILALEEAFSLVQIRADAMQEAVPEGEGAMAAFLKVDAKIVEELCREIEEGYVVPSNYNSPAQTVVSGTATGVETAVRLASERGILTSMLPVSAPFHCELMKPAADVLKKELDRISISKGNIPVYMNVDGSRLNSEKQLKEKLYLQAFHPVLWEQSLNRMYADGVRVFIECGPGKALTGMTKKTLKGVTACRVEDRKTLESTLKQMR